MALKVRLLPKKDKDEIHIIIEKHFGSKMKDASLFPF
jgi:hypothetical protein